MAVTYFPFNSIVVDGVPDRPANAENLAAYLAGFFSNGVLLHEDTALKVEAYSGMDVQINAGMGNINGKTILTDAAEIITLATANATLDRIDRVVFRLDEVNRLMEFDVLTGTPASNPAAPELTQDIDVYELCLAEIRVPAGASEILANYITDTRADIVLCGAANIPKHIHNTAEDRQNINFLGINPITSLEEDTTATWAALGTGVAYYDVAVLNSQPDRYGFIESTVAGGRVLQVFTSHSLGTSRRKWTRTGTVGSDWNEWILNLDERDARIQIARLWSNDSTTSSFPRQTLSMDLSDYPMLIVFHKPTASQSGALGTPLLRGWDGRLINTIGGGTTFRTRSAIYDTSGITFYSGYSGATEDNTALIPVVIYGVKGVQ